jgi:hypothetical protein
MNKVNKISFSANHNIPATNLLTDTAKRKARRGVLLQQ